jgi:transglutaminase-like putative cysteine protease
MNWRRTHLFLALVISFISLSSLVFSQDAPIKWGDIPRADLEMKSFPKDTNASVLVLCDYGESCFNNELNIVFNRHLRVKILTTKGYDWGTFSIRLYTEDNTERIYNIEGITYFLDEQGKIVQSELQKKDVFTENIDGKHAQCKFTLPNLKPGCVIEVRYSVEATSIWFMRDWRFQFDEPVRWSEYRVRYPKAIAYAALHHGYEQYAINKVEDVQQTFFNHAASYLGQNIANCTQGRWVIQNAPALRDEPFITTINDYYNRVDLQLAGYALYGGGSKKVLSDWNTFTKDLYEDKQFGERIDVTRKVRTQAEEITAGVSTPEEKMKALYQWVSQSIVWTHDNRVFAESEVNDVLESKKGTSAEITFLLLSMLKSVGMDCEPVIYSRRDNGQVQDLYPILSEYNTVLARVVLNGKEYFLDATDPLRPMDLLPTKALNVRGWRVNKTSGDWVTLSSPKQYSNVSLAMLTLNADGSLCGFLEDSYRDYASLAMRRDLQEKKDLDLAKETFKTEQQGIVIDSVTVIGRDSIYLPLTLKAWMNAQTYAQSNGDFIYIDPHILHRVTENPFKEQKRNFPVDYAYQRNHNDVVMLKIPEGFEIKQNLSDRILYVGNDLLTYSRKVQEEQGMVKIITKMEVRQPVIPVKYYDQLRSFYTGMVAAEAEQLVLSRIKKSVEVVPAQAVPSVDLKVVKKKGKK